MTVEYLITPKHDKPLPVPINLCSELSDQHETLKPKRDPSKKIHIYRAGQVPGWANEDEKMEAPLAKPKKVKQKINLDRTRLEEGVCTITCNPKLFSNALSHINQTSPYILP